MYTRYHIFIIYILCIYLYVYTQIYNHMLYVPYNYYSHYVFARIKMQIVYHHMEFYLFVWQYRNTDIGAQTKSTQTLTVFEWKQFLRYLTTTRQKFITNTSRFSYTGIIWQLYDKDEHINTAKLFWIFFGFRYGFINFHCTHPRKCTYRLLNKQKFTSAWQITLHCQTQFYSLYD